MESLSAQEVCFVAGKLSWKVTAMFPPNLELNLINLL